MNNAGEDIQYLIKLLQKDLKIKENKDVLESNPFKIKEIDKMISVLDDKLKEKEEKLEEMKKEERHLNGVIKSENDKIKKKKAEENKIKTNAAYRAWEHEVKYLAGKLDTHEERMLALLEKIDWEEDEISQFSDDVAGKKEKLLMKKNELEKEIGNSREQYEMIEDEKLRILPHLSEKVRREYQRILKAKGDTAIGNLVGDVCQGCFSKLPPQKAHEVRKNNKIIKCEFCGRIIVYYPEDQKTENYEST